MEREEYRNECDFLVQIDLVSCLVDGSGNGNRSLVKVIEIDRLDRLDLLLEYAFQPMILFNISRLIVATELG